MLLITIKSRILEKDINVQLCKLNWIKSLKSVFKVNLHTIVDYSSFTKYDYGNITIEMKILIEDREREEREERQKRGERKEKVKGGRINLMTKMKIIKKKEKMVMMRDQIRIHCNQLLFSLV